MAKALEGVKSSTLRTFNLDRLVLSYSLGLAQM